jgi:predicted peptidase
MLVALAAAPVAPAAGAEVARGPGFVGRKLTLGDTVYGYQVFVPTGWNDRQTWPVVLFLHGGVARGTDGSKQTEQGLGPAIRKDPARFPCLAVFPQCPQHRIWADADMQALALKALDETILEFRGDPRRVFLTGVSMGGYGAWRLAEAHPRRFAALVQVGAAAVRAASRGKASADAHAAVAAKISNKPVWLFHGAEDAIVPPSESRNMAEALRAGGSEVRLIEYPGVGHDAWDRAYSEPEFVPWLLSHSLPEE